MKGQYAANKKKVLAKGFEVINAYKITDIEYSYRTGYPPYQPFDTNIFCNVLLRLYS